MLIVVVVVLSYLTGIFREMGLGPRSIIVAIVTLVVSIEAVRFLARRLLPRYRK